MSDARNGLARNAAVLRAVQRAQTLRPRWEPQAESGFVYTSPDISAREAIVRDELEKLADDGYLDRTFVERITVCPSCRSFAVNVHESCGSCGSSRLARFPVLFHFRCGYTGPQAQFELRGTDDLHCPKCRRRLKDLGADYDSPGEFLRCEDCSSTFQLPHVGARCIACGARFGQDEMSRLQTIDAFEYRLNERGTAYLAELGGSPEAKAT